MTTENTSKNSVVVGAQKQEGENLWNNILKEASRSITERTEMKNIIVLGDVNCGKSSLLSRIQKNTKNQTAHKPFALDYSTIELIVESEDEPTLINVWELGDTQQADLLKFGLNSGSLHTSVAVICLDLSHPWTLSESLSKWLRLLESAVSAAANELAPGSWDQLRKQIQYDFQSHLDPSLATAKAKKKKIDEELLRPLSEGILTHNLGVPVIIVGCKSDGFSNLEKDYGFKEAHFEYISQHLRRLALPYGATLMYTSSKNNVNCDLLLKYVKHHLFAQDATFTAQITEKDQLVFPAGADSLARIQADFDNQTLTKDPEELYEEIIKLPKSLQFAKTEPVMQEITQEDADFVAKYKEAWEQSRDTNISGITLPVNSPPMGASRSQESNSTPPSTPVVSVSGSSSSDQPSAKLPPAAKRPEVTTAARTTQAEQEVLANFFNSLINKSSKTTATPKVTKDDLKNLKLPTIPPSADKK